MTIHPTDLVFRSTPQDRPATTKIVVHHTASSPTQTVEAIHAFHKVSRGWSGIGYNIIQTYDGEWNEGRGLDKVGAHAAGHNSKTIGICLIGNFERDEVPAHRWNSLVDMCAFLLGKYGLEYTDVVGHKELAATACPGFDVKALREALRPANKSIADELDEIIERLKDLRSRV